MGLSMFFGVIIGAIIGFILWLVTGNSMFIALGSNTGLCLGLALTLSQSDPESSEIR